MRPRNSLVVCRFIVAWFSYVTVDSIGTRKATHASLILDKSFDPGSQLNAVPMLLSENNEEDHFSSENIRKLVTSDGFSPMQLIKSICPSRRTCQHNITSTNLTSNEEAKAYQSCCPPCDCSDDCIALGNCCHDKQFGFEAENITIYGDILTSGNNETCSYTAISVSPHSLFSFEERNIGESFMLVKTCAHGYAANETLTRCHYPSLNIIEDTMPVYSSSTGVSYANIHCAKCNHVTEGNLTQWIGKLTCNEYIQAYFLFPKTDDNLKIDWVLNMTWLLPECYVKWLPPNNHYRICFKDVDVISNCDDSIDYDANIARLCKTVQALHRNNDTVYKNIYCYSCSTQFNSPCSEEKPLTTLPFSTIINMRQDYSSPTDITTTEDPDLLLCSSGSTYVKELEQCLRLACGTSMISINGQCVSVMRDVIGLNFEYRLKVFYNNRNFRLSPDEILEQVAATVLDEEETKKCGSVINSVETVNDKIIFHITIIAKVVTHVNAYDVYRSLMEKNEAFKHGDIELEADRYVSLPWDYYNFAQYMSSDNSDLFCPSAIAMSDIQFCRSVIIPRRLFVRYQNSSLILENRIFNPNEYIDRDILTGENEGEVQICLDTYISKMVNKITDIKKQTGNELSNDGQPLARFFLFWHIAVYTVMQTGVTFM